MLIRFKCGRYWLNVLVAALSLRLALQQQPSVSQPFFLSSSLLRRQAPPPQFIRPAFNNRPAGFLPPGFAWVSRKKLSRELEESRRLAPQSDLPPELPAPISTLPIAPAADRPPQLSPTQLRILAGESSRNDLIELEQRRKQKMSLLQPLIDAESDPRFFQARAPVKQPFTARIDQSRRPANAPMLERPRVQPSTTVLTAKQFSKPIEDRPPRGGAAPLARPTPAPQNRFKAPPAFNKMPTRPVEVPPSRLPVLTRPPSARVLHANSAPSPQPELALLQFPPGRAPQARSQQAPSRAATREEPQKNRPPLHVSRSQVSPPPRVRARPPPALEQNVVVQKEDPKPTPIMPSGGVSKIGPPGFTPPSNSVIEELNNADNFMAVAERLQLRSLALFKRRRVLAGRAKRHSDSVLKRRALSPSLITKERHSNSEDIAGVPETSIHKTVNMSVPIDVPNRLKRNSKLDFKPISKGDLPLTTIRHAKEENLDSIPLKMITKTFWKMPLTMTVQQKLRIVPKENLRKIFMS